MVVHYKQIVRRFNTLRTKKRYKEKRIRRAYLTEAFLDGELHLYKPQYVTPIDMMHEQQITPKEIEVKNLDDDMLKVLNDMDGIVGKKERTTKLSWFDKLLLSIRRIFNA